jgi:hypothetical protein
MHGLCVSCHRRLVADEPATHPAAFAECATCHRDFDGSRLRQEPPYAPAPLGDPGGGPRRAERAGMGDLAADAR